MRNRLNNKGFSLLEMSIALIILGLVTGTVIAKYNIEMKKRQVESVQAQLSFAQNAISVFFVSNGRYPRPARLDVGPDHPEYGREISEAAADAIAIGTCLNGVCRLNSDIGPVGGTILHGAIPAKTLRITDEAIIDPWKNKYSYVVTRALTNTATFDRMLGNIRLREIIISPLTGNEELVDKFPYIDASSPPAGHFLIFSHGQNGNASFTVEGVLNSDSPQVDVNTGVISRLCDGSTRDESDNCNNDGTFLTTNFRAFGTSGTGLLSASRYFDDFMVASNGVASSGLWQYVANNAQGEDIFSLTPVGIQTTDIGVILDADGNVVRNGVGQPILYTELTVPGATDRINLDVNGSILVQDRVRLSQICNVQGTACFEPVVLAGEGYISCAANQNAPGVMHGIAESRARCANFSVTVSGSCPSGQVAVGVSGGVLQCAAMAGL